jgi:hypothetical protein
MVSFGTAINFARRLNCGRYVLLGNGFSRALFDDIFNYGDLFDRASPQLSLNVRKAFDALDTRDFEMVMNALRNAVSMLKLYDPDSLHIGEMGSDEAKLREVLAHAIAGGHPSMPQDIEQEKYDACGEFLSNFERIYTLNYDLLLYWTLLRASQPQIAEFKDGFGRPDGRILQWINRSDQNVFYLHGALHIFYEREELTKLAFNDRSIPLIKRIQDYLSEGNCFPLIVAEGKSEHKLSRIRRNTYLSHCYSNFTSLDGVLFLHGLSLSERDEHILKMIEKSNVRALFVSIFGSPDTDSNKATKNRVQGIAQQRTIQGKENLAVFFYDAPSARVWG